MIFELKSKIRSQGKQISREREFQAEKMAERQNHVWTVQRTEGGKAGARTLRVVNGRESQGQIHRLKLYLSKPC